MADGVLYDLGDFIDDYATDAEPRNDLDQLFPVDFEHAVPTRLEAVPLALEFCHTRLVDRDEAAWVGERFRSACATFGTEVLESAGRFVIEFAPRDGTEEGPARCLNRLKADRVRSRSLGFEEYGTVGICELRQYVKLHLKFSGNCT